MNTALGTKRSVELSSSTIDPFLHRNFQELITDAHGRGQDYYIARVHCIGYEANTKGKMLYACYDAKELCKYTYEMIISAEGRKIRIKNFKDPMTQQDMVEINFFRLRYDTCANYNDKTTLRAEYVGNQVTFLESNAFRNRIFYQEGAMEALSVHFEFKKKEKIPYIMNRKTLIDFVLILAILFFLGFITFLGFKLGNNVSFKKLFDEMLGKIVSKAKGG